MPRFTAGDLGLVYEETGDGPPLLFISGTSVERTIWGGGAARSPRRRRRARRRAFARRRDRAGLALAAPARVRSLVLVGTWARNDDDTRALFRTWKRLRERDDRAFLEGMLPTGVGIPGARLAMLPRVRHAPFIEKTDVFNAELTAFLDAYR